MNVSHRVTYVYDAQSAISAYGCRRVVFLKSQTTIVLILLLLRFPAHLLRHGTRERLDLVPHRRGHVMRRQCLDLARTVSLGSLHRLICSTLQKLAHRRQLEELEGRGHDESDSESEDTITGPLQKKGKGSSEAIEAIPVILVPPPNKDAQSSNTPSSDGTETLAVIQLQSPESTPSNQKQQLYKNQANSIIEEDEEESESRNENGGEDGSMSPKDKLVKEGAYLKSRLWWFGLLLIAIGEGGEFDILDDREALD